MVTHLGRGRAARMRLTTLTYSPSDGQVTVAPLELQPAFDGS